MKQSVVKPFFQQFSLFLDHDYFLSHIFDRLFDFVSTRSWNITFIDNWIFLISKSISVVLNKHVIRFRLLFFHFFQGLTLLCPNNVRNNLGQSFEIEIFTIIGTRSYLFSFHFFLRVTFFLALIMPRTEFVYQRILLQVGTLSCFIFKNTRRSHRY